MVLSCSVVMCSVVNVVNSGVIGVQPGCGHDAVASKLAPMLGV